MTGPYADLSAVLQQRGRDTPDKTYMVCGSITTSFGEIAAAAEHVAAGLLRHDVQPGDRVGVMLPNCPEIVEAIHGIGRLGAVQVPLNVFLRGEFLRYQLGDAQVHTLITDVEGMQTCRDLLADLPDLRTVFVTGGAGVELPGVRCVDFAELQRPAPPVTVPFAGPDDTWAISYTSGTTGLPKGCVLSRGYVARVTAKAVDFLGITAEDVLLSGMPMYHAGGQAYMVWAGTAAGSTTIAETAFRASSTLRRVVETGATVLMGVGAMGAALLNGPETEWDRAHRLRIASFTPFADTDRVRFSERFGVRFSVEHYGQTECFPLTYTPYDRQVETRTTSGSEADDVQLAIVDDHDVEVPAGQVGEVVIRPRRPYAMFTGYWRKDAATLQTWRNLWHHTGDFGRVDEDGHLTYVDRKKDALRRRGENISSQELEQVIETHPLVAEAAVIGVPSELTEDDVMAFLVLTKGAETSRAALLGFFEASLPYFAVPRYVHLVPELPRNGVFRVMKDKLRVHGVQADTWDLDQEIRQRARRG